MAATASQFPKWFNAPGAVAAKATEGSEAVPAAPLPSSDTDEDAPIPGYEDLLRELDEPDYSADAPLPEPAPHTASSVTDVELDAEDLAAIREVSQKGYYHARPKNASAPGPQRLDVDAAGAAGAASAKRMDFDEFQRKWDRFDKEEPEVEDSPSGRGPAGQARVLPAEVPATAFAVEDAVEVFGLTSESGRKLNGQRGVVSRCIEERGRCEVRFESGEVANVKPANLKHCTGAQPGRACDSCGARSQNGRPGTPRGEYAGKWFCNDCWRSWEEADNTAKEAAQAQQQETAKAASAQSAAAQEEAPAPDTGLSEGRAAKGPAALSSCIPGELVALSGITLEGLKHMNVMQGIVLKRSEELDRLEVRVGSGKVLNIAPGNLQRLTPTPGSEAVVTAANGEQGTLAFGPGCVVEVFDLESQSGKLLNGQTGEVVRYHDEKARFEVQLKEANKAVTLKPENLRRPARVDQAQAHAATEGQQPPCLSPGQHVEVFGLESESGRLLNGQLGVITRYAEDRGRFEVRFGAEKLVYLKPQNLKVMRKVDTNGMTV